MDLKALNKALDWPDQIHSDRSSLLEIERERLEALKQGDTDSEKFYEECVQGMLARHLRSVQGCEHVLAQGVGCTLKHQTREQWATFFPDASETGQYRYQIYDENGFISHSTHDTLADAAYDAAEDGFCVPDDTAPDRVFALRSFEEGNQVNAIIQRINAGHLSMDAGTDQIGTIRRARTPAPA